MRDPTMTLGTAHTRQCRQLRCHSVTSGRCPPQAIQGIAVPRPCDSTCGCGQAAQVLHPGVVCDDDVAMKTLPWSDCGEREAIAHELDVTTCGSKTAMMHVHCRIENVVLEIYVGVSASPRICRYQATRPYEWSAAFAAGTSENATMQSDR